MSFSLAQLSLPLPSPLPSDSGYQSLHGRSRTSSRSSSSAFKDTLDLRDVFQGGTVCVVCGIDYICRVHIISQEAVWEDLHYRKYIPPSAKSVHHEPRNGITLCPNHHVDFRKLDFFIRWVPKAKKFIFVNLSKRKDLEPFHGRAILLRHQDRHVLFPAIFLIREANVRARYPFNQVDHASELESSVAWQPIFAPHLDSEGNLLPGHEDAKLDFRLNQVQLPGRKLS